MIDKTEYQVLLNAVKEKHKFDIVWKILCIIFFVGFVVFACLYFCSGNIGCDTETTEIIVETDGAEIADSIIGNENIKNSTITATTEKSNNAVLYICGTVVFVALFLGGAIIYACKNKKQDKDN